MSDILQLCNPLGTTACFTSGGWLHSLISSGQTWKLTIPQPAWSLNIIYEGTTFDVTTKTPATEIIQQNDSLVAKFNNVSFPDGKDVNLDIVIKWWLDGDLLCADIKVGCLPSGYILNEIILPDVAVAYLGRTKLIIAKDSGFLLDDAANVLFRADICNGSFFTDTHLQLLGWQDDDKGLYFESRDIDGWMKYWELKEEPENQVRFRQHHITPRDLAGDFELPYQVGLGAFSDGWYECALKYRKWALNAPWSQRDRTKRENSYISQLACWLWNRGRADDVCQPTLELSKRLGLPVTLDWYWWHAKAYDTGYPEYFPPRDGEEKFKSSVKNLQAAGNFVQVYTNGMSWDMELPSWETDGKDCAVKYENGDFQNVIYNTWTNHRLAHICGASKKWHEKILEIADEVSRLGLNGLYLDQIAFGGGQCPCHSKTHGHKSGGGCYGVAGYRQILQEIRKRYPDLVLSSEGTLEFFNDVLDANITLSPSFERCRFYSGELKRHMTPIPLFSAIYHGLAVCFGNYAIIDAIPPYDEFWPEDGRIPHDQEKNWHALCPDQFAMEIARTVSFGIQPMVANLTMEHLTKLEFASDIEFLVNLCKFYHANRNWLLWGEMLPHGVIKCPDVQIKCVERGVFTKPDEASVELWNIPAVLFSVWKDENENAAAFLINYQQQQIEFEYILPDGCFYRDLPLNVTATEKNTVKVHMSPRSMVKIDLCSLW